MLIERVKIDQHTVRSKKLTFNVLQLPYQPYAWAYDDLPEEDMLAIDKSKGYFLPILNRWIYSEGTCCKNSIMNDNRGAHAPPVTNSSSHITRSINRWIMCRSMQSKVEFQKKVYKSTVCEVRLV